MPKPLPLEEMSGPAAAREYHKGSIEHRPCACHPDDWPQHIPCQHKYAFKDCAIEAIRQNLAMIK